MFNNGKIDNIEIFCFTQWKCWS